MAKDAKVVGIQDVPQETDKDNKKVNKAFFQRGLVGQPGIVVWQDTFKQDEKTLPFWYAAPSDAQAFQKWLATLPVPDSKGEGPLADAFAQYMYAVDLKGRASEREAKMAESTIVKRDGKDIDILALPIEKCVAAVNGAFSMSAAVGGEPQRAFIITRQRLLEGKHATGKVREQNGVLAVVK